MPTYQYQCTSGHRFDRMQKMSDKPLRKCPECGAKAERIISGGSGLIFKGTGFYITDYGKDGKGPRKDSAAEGGGDTKAAAPTAAPAAAPVASPAPAPAAKSAGDGGAT